MNDFQEFVRTEMWSRVILRLDLVKIHGAFSTADAELLDYWSDEEGACATHICYHRAGTSSTIKVGILSQAFMQPRRDEEIAANLQPILTNWAQIGWKHLRDQFIRAHYGDANGWSTMRLLISELEHSLNHTCTRLDSMIREANNSLAALIS
jgi:hypothetical protein